MLLLRKLELEPLEDFSVLLIAEVSWAKATLSFHSRPDNDSIPVLNACQHALLRAHDQLEQSLKHSALPNQIQYIEGRV